MNDDKLQFILTQMNIILYLVVDIAKTPDQRKASMKESTSRSDVVIKTGKSTILLKKSIIAEEKVKAFL